jgi:DnaJ-domain-containing protein 1
VGEAVAPYLVSVGVERCRERFVRRRRPMFDRLVLRGDCVVALPRRGTKTAGPVAFALASGREVEIDSLPAAEERLRFDYRSSPVGRGPSQLRVVAGEREPVRTLELPDAISAVCEAPFGWYVGCRDGFLYALDRAGELRWRWQTPGAAAFRVRSPADVYFRPCPYRLAGNGRSALVSWFGSFWSVSPEGVCEWGLSLQDLIRPHVIEVRLRGRPDAAASALGLPAHASLQEIKRAYRRAAKQAHPDLHPDDASAAERFRRVQEAYEALTGQGQAGGSGGGAGVIRFVIRSAATVSFLAAVEGDWLVGASAGSLFRLSSEGRLIGRVRVGRGALFLLRDSSQAVVGFCSYPLAGRPQPNLWFVDADAPVFLPDQYPWPDHLHGSYGSYLLSHRPRARDLGLIDESGRLAIQVRCPRPISSVCVAEGALVLAAGALICLEIDGLSPLTRTRTWRPPFARDGSQPPTDSTASSPARVRE